MRRLAARWRRRCGGRTGRSARNTRSAWFMPAIGARSTWSKTRSARWSGCSRAPRSARRQAAASSTASRAPEHRLQARRTPAPARPPAPRRALGDALRARSSAAQPSISGSRARQRLGHGLEQQALAQAVGREHHALDAQPLDQALQHHGGVGQGLQAALGDALDPLQRAARLAGDEAARPPAPRAGSSRTGGRSPADSRHAHVQQGQVAPGAADRVEASAC